jgi:enoyl-CoA hydratase/carnithine racemase
VYRAALPIFKRRKPLVAVVQGPAVGGGLGLALAADFRFAAPEARFHANFVRIGLHPGFGLTYTLSRAIGTQKAAELLLSGRRVDGSEALRLGLADRVAPLAMLRTAAVEFAAAIGEGAPLAIRSIQSALIEGLAESVELAMDREAAAQETLMGSADFREGVQAAAERRTPQFTGT